MQSAVAAPDKEVRSNNTSDMFTVLNDNTKHHHGPQRKSAASMAASVHVNTASQSRLKVRFAVCRNGSLGPSG